MATSPIGYSSMAAAAGASGASASASTDPSQDPNATKQEFISLLVAQLQNQDPTNPTDGTQFLSQLTEINSLEQLLEIRQDLDTLSSQTTPAGSATPAQASGANRLQN
jgi:flagellar basal-body rod modification protein FlgD